MCVATNMALMDTNCFMSRKTAHSLSCTATSRSLWWRVLRAFQTRRKRSGIAIIIVCSLSMPMGNALRTRMQRTWNWKLCLLGLRGRETVTAICFSWIVARWEAVRIGHWQKMGAVLQVVIVLIVCLAAQRQPTPLITMQVIWRKVRQAVPLPRGRTRIRTLTLTKYIWAFGTGCSISSRICRTLWWILWKSQMSSRLSLRLFHFAWMRECGRRNAKCYTKLMARRSISSRFCLILCPTHAPYII